MTLNPLSSFKRSVKLSPSNLDARKAELDAREFKLNSWEEKLDQRERNLDQREARLEPAPVHQTAADRKQIARATIAAGKRRRGEPLDADDLAAIAAFAADDEPEQPEQRPLTSAERKRAVDFMLACNAARTGGGDE